MRKLLTELKRRNVFRVAVLYAVAGWLILQVADVLFGLLSVPEWSLRFVFGLILLGLPVALTLSWIYELTPEGIKLEKDIDRSQSITPDTGHKINLVIAALLVLVLVVFALDRWVPGLGSDRKAVATRDTDEDAPAVYDASQLAAAKFSTDRSIAVLPFVNMSDSKENEYFSDGISEEILNLLVKVDGLRVASRTSAFSFKGKDVDIPAIAERLRVAHVLEGSVRRSGERVRITAQLIEVTTDSHLWSDSYDRDLEDVFAVQAEIANHIVEALEVVLGPETIALTVDRGTENIAAYELYMRGRYLWHQRGEENIRLAIDLFEQAVELDPEYAKGWTALGMGWSTLPWYSDYPTAQAYEHVERAASKALAIDASQAEAHALMADALGFGGRLDESLEAHRRAIEMDPRNATMRLWFGESLTNGGYIREAREQFLEAYRHDSLYAPLLADLAFSYHAFGDNENARRFAEAAADLDHNGGFMMLTVIERSNGNLEAAEGWLEKFLDLKSIDASLAPAFLATPDDPARHAEAIDQLRAAAAALSAGDIASDDDGVLLYGFLWLGDLDGAFQLAMSRAGDRESGMWAEMWGPNMALFRQDPRFAEYARASGMLDVWRAYNWPDLCRAAGDGVECD